MADSNCDQSHQSTTELGAFVSQQPHDSVASSPTSIERVSSAVGCVFALTSLGLFVASLTTYGARDGLILAMLLGCLVSLTAQFGWIPVAGPLLFWFVSDHWTLPLVFRWLPTVHPTWVTAAYQGVGFGLACILTGASSLALIAVKHSAESRSGDS